MNTIGLSQPESREASEAVAQKWLQLLLLLRQIDEWLVSSGGSSSTLADLPLDGFSTFFDCETAGLLLIEDQWLRIVATDPRHTRDIDRRLWLELSITGLAATQKHSVRIDDVQTAAPHLRQIYQPVLGTAMRSELAVPIIAENKVIGALNMEDPEPYAFNDEDRVMAEALAQHLGMSVRIAEIMWQQAASRTAAMKFSRLLADEVETAKNILDLALELIGNRSGQILRSDLQDDLRVIWATDEKVIGVLVSGDASAAGLALLPSNDPYLVSLLEEGAAIRVGRSLIIPDVNRVSRSIRLSGLERMVCELAIPIATNGDVVGVFNVESRNWNTFGVREKSILENFVREHLHVLVDALRESRRDVLGALMQQGLDLVGEECGHIIRVEGEQLVIEYTTEDEPVGTRVGITNLETGDWAPVTGRAAKTNTSIYVPDVVLDPGYMRFLGVDMKSELIVPLITGGETIGVITLDSPIPGYFRERHVHLLEAMAAHAAAAMANVRAVKDRELAAIGEKSGDIIHRLAGPSGAIRFRINRLREKRSGLLEDDYVAMSLNDIDSNAQRIQGFIQKFRESVLEPMRSLELWPILRSALSDQDVPEGIRMEVHEGSLQPNVWANPTLRDVFQNLTLNAFEAMPYGGLLEITVGQIGSDWVAVTFRDSGLGIPKEFHDKVFNPSFSTKDEQGHGLGLYWCKAYVESCGGRIELESYPGHGACFSIWLRQA